MNPIGVSTELAPCRACGRVVRWRYLEECWSCAKARLIQEDASEMVLVHIDPAVRAILEGDEEPRA